MICLSVDPGKENIAIIVADVNLHSKTISIIYNTTARIDSDNITVFHSQLLREIRFLFDLYVIELTTVEMQQKGTNVNMYLHNLYNTNVQAILSTIATILKCMLKVVDPKQ